MAWHRVFPCLTGAALLLAAGCQRAPSVTSRDAGTQIRTEEEDRDLRRRGRDAMVFVDGRVAAVMRFRELPPDLVPTLVRYGNKQVVRFAIADYLQALGIDPARIREVHL